MILPFDPDRDLTPHHPPHQVSRVRAYFSQFERDLDSEVVIWLKCGFTLEELHYDVRLRPAVSIQVVPLLCIRPHPPKTP